MTIKIAHIAKYSHNIGEGALIRGIHETFKADVSNEIEFFAFDRKDFQAMHGREFADDSVTSRVDRDFVKFINDNFHMLMIGGGGVFQTGHYDQIGGMAVAGDLDALYDLRCPLVIYGVGDNRFNDANPFEYQVEFLNLIDYINSYGYKFSFRDDGSCERLSAIVSKNLTDQLNVIPDPGLFINIPFQDHPLVSKGHKTILFQVAGDRLHERLSINGGLTADECIDSFVRDVVEALSLLSLNFDARIILTPHIPSDYELIFRIIKVASEKRFGRSGFMRERVSVNYCSAGFDGAPDFFSIYPLVDLVIGMRFHSVVCASGLGVPCIAIDTMPKVGHFMERFGLGRFAVPSTDANLTKSLYESASSLLYENSEWMRIRNESMLKAREDIHEFNSACARLL